MTVQVKRVALRGPGGAGVAQVADHRVDEFIRNGWTRVEKRKPVRRKPAKDPVDPTGEGA